MVEFETTASVTEESGLGTLHLIFWFIGILGILHIEYFLFMCPMTAQWNKV